jgi:hypothetical protein
MMHDTRQANADEAEVRSDGSKLHAHNGSLKKGQQREDGCEKSNLYAIDIAA